MSSPWFSLVSKELLGAKNRHQAKRKWRASGLVIHKKLYNHHCLSSDTTKTLVSAFVPSRPDYYNYVMPGCPLYLLNKLQKVQNNTACLVLRAPKTDHISPHLASLLWLPSDIMNTIQAPLEGYNCLSSATPVYLTELLKLYKPTNQLCSSSATSILCLPSVITHWLAQRYFSYAAPAVCNSPPCKVRSQNTLMQTISEISLLHAILLTVCVRVSTCSQKFVLTVLVLCTVMLQSGEIAHYCYYYY